MNENSDDSQSKNKYSCINSIFTSCFGKKCSKKKKFIRSKFRIKSYFKRKKGFFTNENPNKRFNQFRNKF